MSVEYLMEEFKKAAEQGEPGEMHAVIGGVDLKELKAAHAQHPLLSRWHNTTLSLISDQYDEKVALRGAVQELEAVALEQAKRIKELEDKYEPKDDSEKKTEATGQGVTGDDDQH